MSNARPFFDTARDIRRGQFLEDCADELLKVVKAAEETGKSGKLVITLTIKPTTKGNGVTMLSDEIVAKLPRLPAGETVFFVTPDNNLVANDPRQKALDLKSIPQPGVMSANLKTVNGA